MANICNCDLSNIPINMIQIAILFKYSFHKRRNYNQVVLVMKLKGQMVQSVCELVST
jgi:hypothetical protein